MKNIGNTTLAAWLVTFLLGYFGLGAWLYEAMEGMDRSMVPLAPSIAFAIGVVTSIVLTVMWARNLGSDAPVEDKPSGRRKFLLGGAAVTGGVLAGTAAVVAKMSPWLQSTVPMMNEVGQEVLTAEVAHESWKGSRIVSKRPLGSTGFMVSDISIGTGRIMRHTNPEDLFREALDRGINLSLIHI